MTVRNVHITRATLAKWIDPRVPIHPLFFKLSAVHQSDYLRCYLLHVHGGGYSDLKWTSRSWVPFFEAVEKSSCLGAGYTEIGPHGVAPVGGRLEKILRKDYAKLIGCGAMIFKPRTEFTERWFLKLTATIDRKASELSRNPAQSPRDRPGVRYATGELSRYPIRWTELMGNIFHPLIHIYQHRILHLDMAPSFENYK